MIEVAPDLSSASDFTRDVAARLFAKRPEWAKMSSVVSEDGEQFLRIRIPAPEGSDLINPWSPEHSDCLWLETNNGEITIGVDSSHQHFTPYRDNDVISLAITAIGDIIADNFIFVTLSDADGRVRSSSMRRMDAEYVRLPFYEETAASAANIRVRSWTGKHDASIAMNPKGLEERP